jgi:cyclophilin family peptidyl-prolyl cis-trans isomerase
MTMPAILAFALAALAQAETPKTDLALSARTDKTDYILGEDVQVEVTLTNSGDRDQEVGELSFDERSVSFDVTFQAAPDKTRQFVYTVTRPDPHLAERLPPARVTLQPKKSFVAAFRVPTLKTGNLTIAAVYKGLDKELRSAPLTLKVAPQAGDAARLAAIVETTMGAFQIDLLPEEAPLNVSNFVSLARRGFYNNLMFHRVIKDGWVQTGCPYENGFGGPGYAVRSEAEAQTVEHGAGTVSMSGHLKTGFHGSQFFICLSRFPAFDKKYTVIGKVPEAGLETLRKIGAVEVDRTTDRPLKDDVRVKEIKIVVVK